MKTKPENLISLSSPIMISSIKSHLPNRTLSGVSNVEIISPPKKNENLFETQENIILLVYQVLVLNVQHLQNLHVQ
jgi:hypothetical protein